MGEQTSARGFFFVQNRKKKEANVVAAFWGKVIARIPKRFLQSSEYKRK
jgi:hypothetical protein